MISWRERYLHLKRSLSDQPPDADLDGVSSLPPPDANLTDQCVAIADAVRPIPTTNTDPSISSVHWDEQTSRALLWLESWTIPTDAFRLYPWCEVTDPELFLVRLRGDVSAGPRGARARYGALQLDLQALHGIFGGSED